MNVGLRFVTESETHGQRRPDFPVVTDETSEIELTCRKAWVPGNDAELGRSATESRDLQRCESESLEQDRPPIPFDGSDRRQYLTCRVKNPPIVCI